MRKSIAGSLTIVAMALVALGTHYDGQRPADGTARLALGGIHPRISPDGKSIAFSWHGAIWRMPCATADDAHPATMTRLTSGPEFDVEPAWSPTGKQIAFVRSPNMGEGDLHIIDAEQGTELPLPAPVRAVGTILFNKLHFHPDGKRILGHFRMAGQQPGLAWYDIATGQTKPIFEPPRWARYALSHDGESIVYSQSPDQPGQQGGNDGRHADVWKIATSGTGEPVKVTQFPSRIYDVCFAAADQGLLVVSDLAGAHNDVYFVPFRDPDRSARRLTFGAADEDRPSVSTDGRWLAYTDNHRGLTALVVRDLTTEVEHTLSTSQTDYRAPTGTLSLKIIDVGKNEPVTARISLEQLGGKFHAPPRALYRALGSTAHFYCDKEARWDLPAGNYTLRAWRGPEYRPHSFSFTIKPGTSLEQVVPLERFANPAASGWYSGENHIHANYGYGEWYNSPQTMLEQCSGEDLRVCNFMVANPNTDGIFDREFFSGKPDRLSNGETILYWNQEFRSTIWGHMTLVNLQQLVEPIMTGFKETTNPWDVPTNSDIADRAHWQPGHVNYTHIAFNPDDPYDGAYAGKGIPVDVAMGKIDSVDINLAYAASTKVWYRLLNCGFHLPASAGTDCFLNRIRSALPGGDRVYVKIDGQLTYPAWIEGLRAGRSFVSNGPMLEFLVNGKLAGETISLGQPGEVHVTGKALSQFPMDRVELIQGGRVAVALTIAEDKMSATVDQRIKFDRSGWLALRVQGKGHRDHPQATLEAHTSPVYVQVKGTTPAAREDAEYFLKWIDRLSLALRLRDRVPNANLRQHIQMQLDAARAIYFNLAAME